VTILARELQEIVGADGRRSQRHRAMVPSAARCAAALEREKPDRMERR
jgi:hypothetical protein